MKLDRNLKNGSFTIEGYYSFKQISLTCKKSKLDDVDKLLIQVGKVMTRVCKRFISTEVFFVRTSQENNHFFVKFRETITVIG